MGNTEYQIHCLRVGLSINICHTLCCVSPPYLFPTHLLIWKWQYVDHVMFYSVLQVAVCWSRHVLFCPADKNPLDRQHVVVCYVTRQGFRTRGLGRFTVDRIDPMLCTHLVYTYADVNVASEALESASAEHDLEENNITGWCIQEYSWDCQLCESVTSTGSSVRNLWSLDGQTFVDYISCLWNKEIVCLYLLSAFIQRALRKVNLFGEEMSVE